VKRKVLGFLLAVAALGSACFASPITDTLVTSSNGDLGGVAGFTFTATLTTGPNNTFSLDFLVQDTSSLGGSLNDFTISLLGGGNATIDVTNSNLASFSGWAETDNATISGSNNNSGCKTSNGSGGWLCAMGPTLNIGPGKSVDFTFSGTYTGAVYNPFDLKAEGSIGETKLMVSSYMTPSSSSVPEPSAVLLLFGGLGAASLLRPLHKRPKPY
jgi:hypothetical protein